MTGWDLLGLWELHPSVVAGCLAVAGGYLAWSRRLSWRSAVFLAGVATVFVALVSPLDPLSDEYLFSAHMVQHILLAFVAPALFVLGLPPGPLDRLLAHRPVARLERALGRPWVAWPLFVVTLWAWHLPVLYEATLHDERIHIGEHLVFLVTGTIFWWPVLAPLAGRRLAPLAAAAYLFAASLANSLLGIVLTFAPVGIYPSYVAPADDLGLLPLLRGRWGITAAFDQQLGGLFMWVLGMFIFLLVIVAVFLRWYREPEDRPNTAGFTGSAAFARPAESAGSARPARSGRAAALPATGKES